MLYIKYSFLYPLALPSRILEVVLWLLLTYLSIPLPAVLHHPLEGDSIHIINLSESLFDHICINMPHELEAMFVILSDLAAGGWPTCCHARDRDEGSVSYVEGGWATRELTTNK